jgi:serine/threonine protein kinase
VLYDTQFVSVVQYLHTLLHLHVYTHTALHYVAHTHTNTIIYQMIRRAHLPNAADMWSIGVIAHCLLSGSPPFYAATVQELKRAVLQQEPTFSGRRWALLSDASRDFVTRLLQKVQHSSAYFSVYRILNVCYTVLCCHSVECSC